MIGFKFKHFRELQVLTNPNHLVQGLMHDWIKVKTLRRTARVLTNPNHLVRGLMHDWI